MKNIFIVIFISFSFLLFFEPIKLSLKRKINIQIFFSPNQQKTKKKLTAKFPFYRIRM